MGDYQPYKNNKYWIRRARYLMTINLIRDYDGLKEEIETEVQRQSLKEGGYKRFQFHALGTACEICKDIDGKANKRADKVEADRNKRELLILKSLDATASVNKELVRCVRGEKPNGELTEAFNYHQTVKHEMEDYMREKAADL